MQPENRLLTHRKCNAALLRGPSQDFIAGAPEAFSIITGEHITDTARTLCGGFGKALQDSRKHAAQTPRIPRKYTARLSRKPPSGFRGGIKEEKLRQFTREDEDKKFSFLKAFWKTARIPPDREGAKLMQRVG